MSDTTKFERASLITGTGDGIDRDGICHDGSDSKGGISKDTTDF